MAVRDVMQAHPQASAFDLDVRVRCITECLDCAASCTSCADACLAEPDNKELLPCIRLCLDCSDICTSTGRLLARQTATDLGVARAAIEVCLTACRACGDECERHASHHEHCRLCAASCRRCVDACEALIAAIG